jgi:hypothetical protein
MSQNSLGEVMSTLSSRLIGVAVLGVSARPGVGVRRTLVEPGRPGPRWAMVIFHISQQTRRVPARVRQHRERVARSLRPLEPPIVPPKGARELLMCSKSGPCWVFAVKTRAETLSSDGIIMIGNFGWSPRPSMLRCPRLETTTG